MDLNKLKEIAYKTACEQGFHDKDWSNEHCLCLVISELMEAVEADRKGKRADMVAADRLLKGSNTIFYNVYNVYIKGSIEEELADSVIRLLDLAGMINIDIYEFSEKNISDEADSCKDKTFTEDIYEISTMSARLEYGWAYTFNMRINLMILAILGLAKHLNIDIEKHIELKMRYNELRERLHGKKY